MLIVIENGEGDEAGGCERSDQGPRTFDGQVREAFSEEVTFGLSPEELPWAELGKQRSWSRGSSKCIRSLVNFEHA